jgi:hypothetical protein
VVVTMPLSSSSEKEDDVISGGDHREQETAFVVTQTRLKMPKSLQSVAHDDDEEIR